MSDVSNGCLVYRRFWVVIILVGWTCIPSFGYWGWSYEKRDRLTGLGFGYKT